MQLSNLSRSRIGYFFCDQEMGPEEFQPLLLCDFRRACKCLYLCPGLLPKHNDLRFGVPAPGLFLRHADKHYLHKVERVGEGRENDNKSYFMDL